MSKSQDRHSNEILAPFNAKPVPAARALSDFTWERIDDDMVLFDAETMQYHTLNGVAQGVWQSCNGLADFETIATLTGLPVEVVETTVGELGEASLLQTPATTWAVPLNRRRAAKLIAATAAGAVGVPVVLSMTAPFAAQAVSCGSAVENASCSDVGVGTPCGSFLCCWTAPGCTGSLLWRSGGVGFGPGCTGGGCP